MHGMMHRGPLIILNPNRHHCCGLGPHWGIPFSGCGWEHISSICKARMGLHVLRLRAEAGGNSRMCFDPGHRLHNCV